ncbi:glycogen synthase kinase-3 beta-like isoform X6, partial [Vespula squamosa]
MSGVTRVARSRPNGSMSEEASKNPWCLVRCYRVRRVREVVVGFSGRKGLFSPRIKTPQSDNKCQREVYLESTGAAVVAASVGGAAVTALRLGLLPIAPTTVTAVTAAAAAAGGAGAGVALSEKKEKEAARPADQAAASGSSAAAATPALPGGASSAPGFRMSGRPRTTSFAEGNKPPANPPLGGMKISTLKENGQFFTRCDTLGSMKQTRERSEQAESVFVQSRHAPYSKVGQYPGGCRVDGGVSFAVRPRATTRNK